MLGINRIRWCHNYEMFVFSMQNFTTTVFFKNTPWLHLSHDWTHKFDGNLSKESSNILRWILLMNFNLQAWSTGIPL